MPEARGTGTDWNVLVTAYRRESWKARAQLAKYGTFWKTEFRDVFVGRIADIPAALDSLMRDLEGPPRVIPSFSRIIPVEHVFEFEPPQLLDKLKEIVAGYVQRVATGESFDIRLERRGLKHQIDSMAIMTALREHFSELLKAANKEPRLEFKEPDKLITVQTLGKICGVGLLTKEMRARWPFVRV
jgi:tRNA(Ser,Leu) C12 N-acetylase TAN1